MIGKTIYELMRGASVGAYNNGAVIGENGEITLWSSSWEEPKSTLDNIYAKENDRFSHQNGKRSFVLIEKHISASVVIFCMHIKPYCPLSVSRSAFGCTYRAEASPKTALGQSPQCALTKRAGMRTNP